MLRKAISLFGITLVQQAREDRTKPETTGVEKPKTGVKKVNEKRQRGKEKMNLSQL